jgi:CO/xanthine dehydrogenase Mo-binding subunit
MIGQPISRVDGPLKVTGRATYAYEYKQEDETALYGVIVTATIGRGRVQDIDVSDAQRLPGVCVRSALATMNQLGFDFQAWPSTFCCCWNKSAAGA